MKVVLIVIAALVTLGLAAVGVRCGAKGYPFVRTCFGAYRTRRSRR